MADGNCVLATVVPTEVKSFLKDQVNAGRFGTLSKAARYYLILAIRTSNPDFLEGTKAKNDRPKRFQFLRRRA